MQVREIKQHEDDTEPLRWLRFSPRTRLCSRMCLQKALTSLAMQKQPATEFVKKPPDKEDVENNQPVGTRSVHLKKGESCHKATFSRSFGFCYASRCNNPNLPPCSFDEIVKQYRGLDGDLPLILPFPYREEYSTHGE